MTTILNYYQYRQQVKGSLRLGEDKIKDAYIAHCLRELERGKDDTGTHTKDNQEINAGLF